MERIAQLEGTFIPNGATVSITRNYGETADTKAIALTAIAAMAGGVFILDAPIFLRLAVSLLSGLLVSTVQTLVVIPWCAAG